jgi:protein involved in polysaccharide export with SLBB domain
MWCSEIFSTLTRKGGGIPPFLLAVVMVAMQLACASRPPPPVPRPAPVTQAPQPARPPVLPLPKPVRPAVAPAPRPVQPAMKPAPTPALPRMPPPAASRLDYRMGVGDLVRVQVHGEDDLTVQTRLDDKGTITYPFLGEIRVVGLSVRELEGRIAAGLRQGQYLVAPEVQVQVLEYRLFYVNGEVKRPGGYPYVPGLTVQKAVTLAGGFTPLASKSKMFVIRERSSGGAREKIDIEAAIMPGDTLVIEEGLF